MAKLVVSNIDFKDSGKKDPSKKALRMTRVSFTGKLKKNLLKFVNIASLELKITMLILYHISSILVNNKNSHKE
ncbi:MAG: hypothetical protein AAF673_01845 [Pseudomonadota bacterium]